MLSATFSSTVENADHSVCDFESFRQHKACFFTSVSSHLPGPLFYSCVFMASMTRIYFTMLLIQCILLLPRKRKTQNSHKQGQRIDNSLQGTRTVSMMTFWNILHHTVWVLFSLLYLINIVQFMVLKFQCF